MNFGSVCSGIEAASTAFGPLGWKAAWFSEIEKFPAAVLAHHYPDVPNLGDMTRIHTDERLTRTNVDVLCGGTPCQSFSIAGLRKGLDDSRGNLSLVFCKLAHQLRRENKLRYFLWENVPGVLSDKGNAFGCFLAAMVGADAPLLPGTKDGRWRNAGVVSGQKDGFGIAWRILDAQHYGVPQRRRRVFVVGVHSGNWRTAAEVLFKPPGVCGDIAKGGEARQGTAGSVEGGVGTYRYQNDTDGIIKDWRAASLKASGTTTDERSTAAMVVYENHGQDSRIKEVDIVPQLNAKAGTGGGNLPLVQQPPALAFKIHGGCEGGGKGYLGSEDKAFTVSTMQDQHIMAHGQGGAEVLQGKCPILNCNHEAPILGPSSFKQRPEGDCLMGGDKAYTLSTTSNSSGGNTAKALIGSAVRRLTPTECERLQGFPDGYTKINWKNKGIENCPDGPRYKALGNSWAVPCAAWIGRRIQEVDDEMRANETQIMPRMD